jgi:hypothetical protein
LIFGYPKQVKLGYILIDGVLNRISMVNYIEGEKEFRGGAERNH